MNSKKSSRTQATMQFAPTAQPSHNGNVLFLPLRSRDNVISFKNTKMIVRPKAGRPMLITNPKKQAKMQEYIHAFESMLRSAYQTSATGMATGCSLASWIRSCMPLDDSRKWIPEFAVWFVEVPAEEHGANVTITRLPEPHSGLGK